jgi:hypothetical protein
MGKPFVRKKEERNGGEGCRVQTFDGAGSLGVRKAPGRDAGGLSVSRANLASAPSPGPPPRYVVA